MLNRFKQYLRVEKEGSGAHPLRAITVGQRLVFSEHTPIQALAGNEAKVVAVRSYHFGAETTVTYTLRAVSNAIYHLTVAEDAQGLYLGIARELPRSEWNDWFDLDALDFFITPSSARTLKLLANAKAPVAWSAPRYQKMIDALEGELKEADPVSNSERSQSITYTLLASDEGDKAIEIERLHSRDMVRLYATLYRPEEDVIDVLEALPASAEILTLETLAEPVPSAEPELQKIADALKAAEEALRDENTPAFMPKQGARPDFRRLVPVQKDGREVIPEPLPLPSFLLEPQTVAQVPAVQPEQEMVAYTLADVMAPETTQIRCDMVTARALIEQAARRNLAVKDMVRGLLGLSLDVRDEVIFEVPLSDEDYKELAMRYQLKASRREDIQARMLQEIRARMREKSAV